MVHFGLLDFDSGDEEELNLFYLVDSVLDELSVTKDITTDDLPNKADVGEIENTMPAAPADIYTADFMDHFDATFPSYDDSDRSFVSPDSSFVSPGSSYVSNVSYQHPQSSYIPPSAINSQIPDEQSHFPSHQDYGYPSHPAEMRVGSDMLDTSFTFSPKQGIAIPPESLSTHANYINAIDLTKFPADPEASHNDSASVSENGADLSRDLDDLHDYPDLIHINGWSSQASDVTSQKSTVTSPTDTHASFPHSYYDEDSNDGCSDFLSWTCKHPENWSAIEVLDWVYYVAEKNGIDCSRLRGEAFRTVSGELLCKMGPEDFAALDPYYGSFFYELFRKLVNGLQFVLAPESTHYCGGTDVNAASEGQGHSFSMADHPHQSIITDNVTSQTASDNYNQSYPVHSVRSYACAYDPSTSSSAVKSQAGISTAGLPVQFFQSSPQLENLYNYQFNVETGFQETDYKNALNVSAIRAKYEHAVPIRRRPGRPRIKSIPTEEELRVQREKKLKSQHLWEFVYDLLENPVYNPSVLKWENQSEGVFRFVQSETVAHLWGTLKCNENMTYEKLSRAMRHYYKRGILERVEGRRLVYKFSCGTLQRMLEKRAMLSIPDTMSTPKCEGNL